MNRETSFKNMVKGIDEYNDVSAVVNCSIYEMTETNPDTFMDMIIEEMFGTYLCFYDFGYELISADKKTNSVNLYITGYLDDESVEELREIYKKGE